MFGKSRRLETTEKNIGRGKLNHLYYIHTTKYQVAVGERVLEHEQDPKDLQIILEVQTAKSRFSCRTCYLSCKEEKEYIFLFAYFCTKLI